MSDRPIAFFDSGLGGISVLRETRRLMPSEHYVYYGDSANAPYGVRPREEIVALSRAALETVLRLGAKAVVIACNTATGEAVDVLREEYPALPIIGVEPAVKPAAERFPGGRILVAATPMCVQSRRFRELCGRVSNGAEIIPVPCGGLMEFVERGELSGERLTAYLTDRFVPWRGQHIDALVLGCTHYPFLRAAFSAMLGPDVTVIDGNAGIAMQLRRRLDSLGLLRTGDGPGSVTFYNSSDDPALTERSGFLLSLP